jgi:hypothetical protein
LKYLGNQFSPAYGDGMAEDASTYSPVLAIKHLIADSRPPTKGTRVTRMPASLLAEASLDRDERAAAGPAE